MDRQRKVEPFAYTDAFYDRGSTFLLKYFLSDEGSLPQNRRNANLVSKNDVFAYSGHGITN